MLEGRSFVKGSDVLLVQHPPSHDIADAYMSVTDVSQVFASLATLQLARTWPLRVVEVDAPADPNAGV